MPRAKRGSKFTLGPDAMLVLAWALQPGKPLTFEVIMEEWGVSRATAFRWLPRLVEHREMVDLYIERLREREAREARRAARLQQEARLQ